MREPRGPCCRGLVPDPTCRVKDRLGGRWHAIRGEPRKPRREKRTLLRRSSGEVAWGNHGVTGKSLIRLRPHWALARYAAKRMIFK